MCHIDEIMETPFFKANTTKKTAALVKEKGLRNSQLLTIAPTGTLSTMLGISGGIEPTSPRTENRASTARTSTIRSTRLRRTVHEGHNINDDSQLPEYFVTALTLDYHQRVAMQAIWQRHRRLHQLDGQRPTASPSKTRKTSTSWPMKKAARA